MTDNEKPVCQRCGYGPCRLESWARDSSFYSNNPSAFAAAVARNHDWFLPERLAEVARIRAETRALVLPPAFPCRGCGRFSFRTANALCFWCKPRPASKVVAGADRPPPKSEPSSSLSAPARRTPTVDEAPSLF